MRDIKVESRGPATLSVVLKLAVEVAAAQGSDGVGAAHCPEYAGLLEARPDDRLASRFDDPRADKQVLAAKLRVAHTLDVSLKIICLDAQIHDNFWIYCIDGPKRDDKFFDPLSSSRWCFFIQAFCLAASLGYNLRAKAALINKGSRYV